MSLCDMEIFKTAVVQKWGPIKLGQWLICHKEPLVNYNQRSNDLFEWYLDFPSFFFVRSRSEEISPPESPILKHHQPEEEQSGSLPESPTLKHIETDPDSPLPESPIEDQEPDSPLIEKDKGEQ